jgi:hypothetical protein
VILSDCPCDQGGEALPANPLQDRPHPKGESSKSNS